MKLFCSNAYSGEDVNEVTRRMELVVDALRQAGHDPYCPVFDQHKQELQEKGDTKAIFEYAFQNLATRSFTWKDEQDLKSALRQI